MRIVIDMQGAQTESRFRGIGRYTLSLAQAIVYNRGEHEVILALSGLFPDTIESIRAAFDGQLPQENIRVWYAPGPVRECDPGNVWRRDAAELIYEAFLSSLNPDVVLIPSFFEGYQDDGVVSIGIFNPKLTTVISVDSLYLAQTGVANPNENIYTLRKIELLKRADLVLVLPPLTVDEVCQRLEAPTEQVKAGLMVGEAVLSQTDVTKEARGLLIIFEELTTAPPRPLRLPQFTRPKLAYVSPLPPERSGISDYSAELLSELARFYDIDVIVAQTEISTPWIVAHCGVRTAEWFLKNAHCYSRVLYHFGNSPFHQHMFDLLAQVPGIVVLHDFYLDGVQRFREANALSSYAWTRALYDSHGYGAVAERFCGNLDADVGSKYPVNLSMLQQAQGVIVHSEYSRQLASDWYGKDFAADWKVIPLLRSPSINADRVQARATLGLKDDDFVVCSFGMLVPTKLNHRLLKAWLHSRLAQDARCVLIFVGEKPGGVYGVQLSSAIRANGFDKRIRITGWVDIPSYKNYLAATDIAVQLRTLSRGETSAAVLDCMNYALPTIVNANGSMSELLNDGVCVLPNAFSDHHLIEALETLWQDSERLTAMGKRAQEVILTRHAPSTCAEQYAETIELFHATAQSSTQALVKAIAEIGGHLPNDTEQLALAQSISHSMPRTKATRQLLIDVSATCKNDLKTGIQRVVRALVWALIQNPPAGYRIEPVYLTDEGGIWHYRYARKWASDMLDITASWMLDEPIDCAIGDVVLVADFTGGFAVAGECSGLFKQLKDDGVALHFVVFDLLPIQMPDVFPPGSFGFQEWLQAISRVADGLMCISKAVADELCMWLKASDPARLRPVKVGWFHLGADLENSAPTRALPKNAEQTLAQMRVHPSFLMVGTIEPRKGHLQTLEAFTQLWQKGLDVNLIIVGKEGWKDLPEDMRRTIPEIMARLRHHPELGKRLFWLDGISDEYLGKAYAASTCLIAASEGEGFGLPLIEAAQHRLPIIARDIPVFREVAGEHAFYFNANNGVELGKVVSEWLALYANKRIPLSEGMPFLSWKQSAEQIKRAVIRIQLNN